MKKFMHIAMIAMLAVMFLLNTGVAQANPLPTIIKVIKEANPTEVPEPGAMVDFTVTIFNASTSPGPVTITSLVDSIHGDLNGQGNCSVPQVIEPNRFYTCTFQAMVEGNAGYQETDVVTAIGRDIYGNVVSDEDDETVRVTDVPPVINVIKTAEPPEMDEPGGWVTFTVVIENHSVITDPVTITSLIDSIHGDLDGQGDCDVPVTIQPGASYTCSFPAQVTGNAGYSETDVVTASGTDDEGNPVSDDDDAIVRIKDKLPSILVTKTAEPPELPEPGGVVTFTVVIENTSSIFDPVTITSLVDSIHGNLDGQGDCDVPVIIQPGDSYTCSFQAEVTGEEGYEETDVVTASGTDDEGNPVSDDDDAVVKIVKRMFEIYLPLVDNYVPSIDCGLPQEVTVGYEDLPIDSPRYDSDYNDWVADVHSAFAWDETRGFCGLQRVTFNLIPEARGAGLDHRFDFSIPANTFGSDGVAFVITNDANGNPLSSIPQPFNHTLDADFTLFPSTAQALPPMSNTREGTPPLPTARTVNFRIEFATPALFNLSQYNINDPHGAGLFFDPILHVMVNGGYDVGRGDVRLLNIPVGSFLWPEERIPINQVYTGVTGTPPNLLFAPQWWALGHNTCVYGDGVVCPLPPVER